MKGLIIGIALLVLVGCGKTVAQVKQTSDTTIDNGVAVANNVLYTGGNILKTIVGLVHGLYGVGKSAVQDTQDNAATAVGAVGAAVSTGAGK